MLSAWVHSPRGRGRTIFAVFEQSAVGVSSPVFAFSKQFRLSPKCATFFERSLRYSNICYMSKMSWSIAAQERYFQRLRHTRLLLVRVRSRGGGIAINGSIKAGRNSVNLLPPLFVIFSAESVLSSPFEQLVRSIRSVGIFEEEGIFEPYRELSEPS